MRGGGSKPGTNINKTETKVKHNTNNEMLFSYHQMKHKTLNSGCDYLISDVQYEIKEIVKHHREEPA